MAEYKGIKGFNVQTRSSDPTDGTVGDFYYNSATGEYKNIKSGLASGSWSSGSALNTARDNMASIGVSSDAALAAGGSPGSKDNVEKYDGTSWTEVNEINTARPYAQGQFGTYTSGIISGGPSSNTATESWNGSAWTEIAEINTGRAGAAGAGASNTSGVIFGGDSPTKALTEVWNGSSWTETGELSTGRTLYGSGGGTVYTAALAAAGDAGPAASAKTESWDGSSWTEITSVNTARYQNSATTAGAPDAFLIFGGNPSRTLTELWDGSSWTEVSDLSTGRHSLGGAGAATSAIAFGGNNPPPVTNATEEWSASDFEIKTVTTS